MIVFLATDPKKQKQKTLVSVNESDEITLKGTPQMKNETKNMKYEHLQERKREPLGGRREGGKWLLKREIYKILIHKISYKKLYG